VLSPLAFRGRRGLAISQDVKRSDAMNRHSNDIILHFMKREDTPMTADYYCRCNYSLTWEEIKDGEYPEWRADVERLIEDGELFDGDDGEYRLAIPEA
jgi:hypothetical protein